MGGSLQHTLGVRHVCQECDEPAEPDERQRGHHCDQDPVDGRSAMRATEEKDKKNEEGGVPDQSTYRAAKIQVQR